MSNAIYILQISIIAAVTTLLLVPAIRHLAIKNDILDAPNARKIHTAKIPRLGGIGIFLGFMFALIISHLSGHILPGKTIVLTMLPSGILMFLLGLYDDLFSMRSQTKLFVQVIAGCFAFALGFQIDSITLFNHTLHFGPLSIVVTLMWIVFVTNAFNLIDGLDGLAGGVAAIALTAIAILGAIHGNYTLSLMSCLLAGATIGFLRFNFSPASIFMGDSGSYFIGFSLAVLSIELLQSIDTPGKAFVPLMILGIPLFDTSLAIVRRFLKHVHYISDSEKLTLGLQLIVKKILSADNEHVHHLMLKHGCSQRAAAIRLYISAAFLSAVAIGYSFADDIGRMLLLGFVIVFAVVASLSFGAGHYLLALYKSSLDGQDISTALTATEEHPDQQTAAIN